MDEKSVVCVATVRAITIDERDGYCCREVAEFLKRMIFWHSDVDCFRFAG